MGRALDLVSFTATAAAVAGTAGTAVAGDSLTVRNAVPGSRVRMVSWWALLQTGTRVQVTHPTGHDVTRDLRMRVPAAIVTNLLPAGVTEVLQPQEVIAATIFGTAVAADVENSSMLIAYDDLPGIEGHYISPEELEDRREVLVSVEATITETAGGAYEGAEAISAESDLLKANREYALIGATFGVGATSIRVAAPDWGNLGIGIPADALNPEIPANWFPRLSAALREPWVPVFNSANRGNVLISTLGDENGADTTVSLLLALLR